MFSVLNTNLNLLSDFSSKATVNVSVESLLTSKALILIFPESHSTAISGVPRTLEEIGEEFDLTRERIRQLEKLALCRLRHPSFGIREQDLV